MTANRLLPLDALRGIAALTIAVRHLPQFFDARPFPESYLAVDLFFCLSGYVLARAYSGRIAAGMTARRFMALRLIRLYPLYALGTALGLASAAAFLVGNGWAARQIALEGALGVLMLPAPVDAQMGTRWAVLYPLDGPAWSLAFELAANLLFALGLSRVRFPAALCAAVMAVSAAGLAWTWLTDPRLLDGGYEWSSLLIGAFRVGWAFPAGVALHALDRDRAARRRDLPLGLAAVASATALLLSTPPPAWRASSELASILFVVPVCVLLAARCPAPPAALARLCAALGAMSYALYAIHEPAGRLVRRTAETLAGVPVESFAPWGGIALLALLAAVSLAAERLYDAPVRRALAAPLAGIRYRPSRAGGQPK